MKGFIQVLLIGSVFFGSVALLIHSFFASDEKSPPDMAKVRAGKAGKKAQMLIDEDDDLINSKKEFEKTEKK